MNIQLYFFPGTCSRVAMIALEQCDLKYETIVVHNRKGETHTPQYLALNPAGQVPVLVVDGSPLPQNLAIISWLDRICPQAGLFPATTNEFDKARQTSDMSFVSSSLHPLVTRLALPQLFADESDADAVRRKAKVTMNRFWEIVEQRFRIGEWWYGEDWSIVDAYLYWVHWVVEGAGIDVSGFPNFNAMTCRIVKQPSVLRAMKREETIQTTLEREGRGFLTWRLPRQSSNGNAGGSVD